MFGGCGAGPVAGETGGGGFEIGQDGGKRGEIVAFDAMLVSRFGRGTAGQMGRNLRMPVPGGLGGQGSQEMLLRGERRLDRCSSLFRRARVRIGGRLSAWWLFVESPM